MTTLLSLVIIALLIAAITVLSKHTIVVINRKDPAMATIKERLAALEAAAATQASAAASSDVAALAERVTAIEAEIGTDPAPEAMPTADGAPAPVDPAQPSA